MITDFNSETIPPPELDIDEITAVRYRKNPEPVRVSVG
jgi:hypothetical protein